MVARYVYKKILNSARVDCELDWFRVEGLARGVANLEFDKARM